MNTFVRFWLLALTAAVSTSPFASDLPVIEHKTAIEISIGGSSMGFDASAYDKIRKVIGSAFANEVVDTLTVYGYGNQGGFSVCAEGKVENPDTKTATLLLKRLKTIHPQDGTTYSVQRVGHCFALTANTDKTPTFHVFKPNNSTTCNINSGIPLTTMRQELAAINVYSAKKVLPNGIFPNGCGFDTNENNIYEISETDIGQALSLGFNTLSEMALFALASSDYSKINNIPGHIYVNITFSIENHITCRRYDKTLNMKYVGACI